MNDRRFQQSADFEIRDQRRRGLIDAATGGRQAGFQIVMVVPGRVHEELHETDAALDQPAGDEAAGAELARFGLVEAIECFGGRVFLAQIERFLGGGLHPRGQFIAGDRASRSASWGCASRCR